MFFKLFSRSASRFNLSVIVDEIFVTRLVGCYFEVGLLIFHLLVWGFGWFVVWGFFC